MARQKKFPRYPTKKHSSGQARINLEGKDVYLGAFGSEESWQKYQALRSAWRAGVPGERLETACELPTVGAVVARWLEYMQGAYDPSGNEPENFRLSLRPLVRLYETTLARDFDALALVRVREAMATGSWMTQEEKDRYNRLGIKTSWSRTVINRRITRIKTVWRWAAFNKLVPAENYQHLRTLPALSHRDRSVRHLPRRTSSSEEETMKVVEALRTSRKGSLVAAMLHLQWLTGMRSAEVRLMKAGEVERGGNVWHYRPARHKNAWREGHPERVVSLGPVAQGVLASWLEGKGPEAFVFTRRNRRTPLSKGAYASAVQRAARKAGVVGFHAYRCRHSMKERITREFGLDVARAALGQTSLSTTDHYGGHQDVAAADRAAARLG